jgi:Flp pilus assembly secretin CpaC
MIREEPFIRHYEPVEGEPGKLAPQLQHLEIGWKFKIHAKILDSGEKVHIKLAVKQQESGFETRQYQPGYDYQIPFPPEIFVAEITAKNGEPVAIGRLRHGETAYCLVVTPSAILPERQPEPLLGKKIPEPDNIQNIEALKQIEGNRILICFWDMNQRPSRNLIGELAKQEKELAEKDIAVYLVQTSKIEPAKLKEWLDNRNITFPCGSINNDAEKVLFSWGVRAQPWLILTDQEGIVKAEGFGLEQLDEKLQMEESAAENSGVPVLAKSAAPSGVDKPIVKIDLSVVEVWSDSKMDRETIVEIKNLLAGKITVPDSPAVADLLRKAAKAMTAVNDESAGDKRVTQKQFATLFDLLESRGFVKILMNPTLEVTDGQTAKISSKQKIPNMQDSLEDSIQITPYVSKETNKRLLLIQASIHQRFMSQRNKQIPIVTRQAIVDLVRLNPGESCIIGGTEQAEAGLIVGPVKDTKDLEVPNTEVLVILTPTIVGTVSVPQNEIDKPAGPTKQSQTGTDKDKIQIDTRILFASDDFLKTIGLDANSIYESEAWSEHLTPESAAEPNSPTFRLILDELNVNLLCRAIAARMQTHKDLLMLTKPRVLVRDSEEAAISTRQETVYISGYEEPNSPSEKPTPKLETRDTGTSIWFKPHLTPDKENVYLQFESKVAKIMGFKERTYLEKYTHKIPLINTVEMGSGQLIPLGKTLLIGGYKITEEVERTSRTPWLGDLPLVGMFFSNNSKIKDQKTLLIMIKPSTDIKAPPPMPQPIDPNDPLIKKLEEKFKRYDEQK